MVHGQDAPAEARDRLEALGLQREVLPACEPESLMAVLAQRGCNRVLWECGPELAAAALQQACVQELAAVIAPKLLGGEPARTPLGHLGFQAMEEVVVLQGLRQQRLADDLLLQVTLSPLSDPVLKRPISTPITTAPIRDTFCSLWFRWPRPAPAGSHSSPPASPV